MINITKAKSINIGKQGENNAITIEFDLQPFISTYGAGRVQLLHLRSRDEVPYIVDLVQSGTKAIWTITSDDTAYSGYGRAQLNYYVDNVLAKTVVFTTICAESLTDETDTPVNVKNAVELLTDEVGKKLEPSNIIAGDNVTITIDGMNVTISSTGGGVSDAYTKAETDALLAQKQDKGDYATSSELSAEELARQNADNNLQGQIDAITVSSDVIDVVGTYTDLENYDTQHVKANDIIKVLQDSTHNDSLSYYRWVITENVGAWTYVGSEGPFYTKSEADVLLQAKQNVLTAGKGITLNNDVISAVPRRMVFADEKPSSGIDNNAIYLIPDSQFFPSVELLVGTYDGATQKAAVTYDEGIGYRFIRFDTNGNTFYAMGGGAKSFVWQMFTTDGKTWTQSAQSAEGGDNTWATLMGWGSISGASNVQYPNVMWANADFRLTGAYKHWDTTKNKAKIDGTAETGQTVPAYQLMMWQYNGSTWESLGVCDYTELFDKVETEISGKQDTLVSGTSIKTINSTSLLGSGNIAITEPLTFTNLSVATTDWVSDSTYNGYGYKAVLTCSGVTASMVADVYFSGASAVLGTLAPFCDTGSGTVTIYCSANDSAVTIDKVVAL